MLRPSKYNLINIISMIFSLDYKIMTKNLSKNNMRHCYCSRYAQNLY